ncbi:MAG: 5'-nucleotidase C-terminal domain-containing protein [Lachnospiraceae bacterium]
MKRTTKLFLTILLIFMLDSLLLPTHASEPKESLTILFTHDTHDHFLPLPAEGGGEYGGYTRLATLLKKEREESQPTITLDAGDFSMGSLFQTIYATEAPELRALGAMGYDVTTLGNHEYDYRSAGLADMLTAAKHSGERLPAIVQGNYKPKAADTKVVQAWDDYPITDYTVIEKGIASDGTPLRIAVFGVLGVDADMSAPMSNMSFTPTVEAAKKVVTTIKEKEDADFIVCVSHAGTNPEPKKSEDEQLAKAVSGIDVIISGHTHAVLETPIQVNDTWIVSCGQYTENLGRLTVSKNMKNEKTTVQDYQLIPIDETVVADPEMVKLANQFKAVVENSYLAKYDLTYDEVLAQSPFDFTPISKLGEKQKEDGLGNLISDSYVYAVKEAEGKEYRPVDFAVVAAGVVRASFPKGNITASDAFNVSSLGVGGDGTPGYPLISVYLTGQELRDAFEVDASVTPLMPAAQLYGSGMTWTFNPHRIIFNKVTDCAQLLPDGTKVSIEDKKLYRVVTGLYSGQMLGAVNDQSFGILSVTPKDDKGKVITDFERQIIHNQEGEEVKEWYALASYLKSMDMVPQTYAEPMGRKIVDSSWNPIELLKNPNKITLLVIGIGILLMVFVILIIRFIMTKTVRKRQEKNIDLHHGKNGL